MLGDNWRWILYKALVKGDGLFTRQSVSLVERQRLMPRELAINVLVH